MTTCRYIFSIPSMCRLKAKKTHEFLNESLKSFIKSSLKESVLQVLWPYPLVDPSILHHLTKLRLQQIHKLAHCH